MPPDMRCSVSPNSWFGVSIQECCIEHDLAHASEILASDDVLRDCIATTLTNGGVWAVIAATIGTMYFVGVRIGRPIYQVLKRLY